MRFKHFVFFSSLIILGSCSTYKGVMLEPKCMGDCSFQSFATGSAHVSYFLGMGGNSSESLLFEAKRNMYQTFPLKKGEFYDNIIIDYKNSYYLVFSKLKITITADIVNRGTYADSEVYTENYKHFLASGKTVTVDHLALSDSVIYLSGTGVKKGILLGFFDGDAKVLVLNSRENMQEEMVPVKRLFAIDNEDIEDITGLEANQIIEFISGGKNKEEIVKEVVGLKPDRVLMKISRNRIDSYVVVPIEKLKYK